MILKSRTWQLNFQLIQSQTHDEQEEWGFFWIYNQARKRCQRNKRSVERWLVFQASFWPFWWWSKRIKQWCSHFKLSFIQHMIFWLMKLINPGFRMLFRGISCEVFWIQTQYNWSKRIWISRYSRNRSRRLNFTEVFRVWSLKLLWIFEHFLSSLYDLEKNSSFNKRLNSFSFKFYKFKGYTSGV